MSSLSFTKLFSSITDSSIWQESSDSRVVWVTLLAMADPLGRIQASVSGLARRSNVSREATESALAVFLAPDPDSRTTDHEGRRIDVIAGGWQLLNYRMYREMKDDEARKEKNRIYQERHRSKSDSKGCQEMSDKSLTVSINKKMSAQEEGEGEVEVDKARTNKSITIAPLGAVKVHPDLEIYNAYPRKEGKGAAMTEINRAVARLSKGEAPHVPMEKLEAQRYLMRRVLEYARSPVGSQSDKTKIPHPATWFHQKRYDDDQSNWHRMEMTNGRQHSKTGGNLSAGAQAFAYLVEQASGDSESVTEMQHEEGVGGDSGDLRHLRTGSIEL